MTIRSHMATNKFTDFEKEIMAESYMKHKLRLQSIKPKVDATEPKAITRIAVYNKPKLEDPIFPTRPHCAVNYDISTRHADTVKRLKKKIKELKPAVDDYVDY